MALNDIPGASPPGRLHPPADDAPRPWRLRLIDLLFLLVLLVLALLPPIHEIHKQLLLAGIGVVQLAEGRLLSWRRRLGPFLVVGLKLVLAWVLLAHTAAQHGEPAINSAYWPILFIPVITAALYSGVWGTLAWTVVTSATYCLYLVPALQHFSLTRENADYFAMRNVFFFLAALIVTSIASEMRHQRDLYRQTAATLELRNRELTEARAEAQRAERLAALGQLSGGLAHEIRNPLGVIKGAAEMLRKKLDPGDALAAELAGYISSEVNRLNALVARFLDFARPLALSTRPEAIVPVMERALRSVAERWPEARVTVERAYAPDLPPLEIDAALCESVFVNLASNAYEAMNFSGRLVVSAALERRGGVAGVVIQFADSGPGVPAHMAEQIFNPFVTTKETGVGLGLSVVSKIVDQHRGALRLCPSAVGACFEVFLPAGGCGAPAAAAD